MLPANPFRQIQKLVLQERGMPGTGVSAIEKAQMLADINTVMTGYDTLNDRIDEVKSQAYDVRDYVSDTTGATDVSAEMQALLDLAPAGSTILFPQGTKLRMTRGLSISKANVQLRGPGEMHWTELNRAGANHDAIKVTGDGVVVDGLRLTGFVGDLNTRLMEVHANDFSISNCFIDNWANGVRQMPHGEFRGFLADGNIIVNIYGAAREDTGDGILAAGIDVVISNNIVRAKPGADARIGIVVEGLPAFMVTPIHSYSTNVSDSSFIVTGNIVTGSFRRGIHAEGVSDYIISDNICYGMGWWGIIAWSTQRGVISGNMINWTRTASAPDPEVSPTTGGNLERRSALFILTSWNVKAHHNTITINEGATAGLPNAVELYENVHITFERNDIFVAGDWFNGDGVFVTRAFTGVTSIEDNRLRGSFRRGIMLTASSGGKVFIKNNKITKIDEYDACIQCEGNATLLILADNFTEGGVHGIRIGSGVTIVAKHNEIINATTGIEFFGGTNKYAPNNTFVNVTTKVIGATSTTAYGP